MKDVELAYLAGIIDGEGCISVTISHRHSGYGKFRIQVSISNTNLKLIEKCKQIVGFGSIGKRTGSHIGKRTVYKLELSKYKKLYELLPKLIPFLIDKKRKAELTFELIKEKMKHEQHSKVVYDHYQKRIKTTTPILATQREIEIMEEIRRLNEQIDKRASA